MKRIISLILVLVLAVSLLCGCKKADSDMPFDYDLSKYITLGDYVGIEYKYELEEVTQEAVDSFVNSALTEKGYGEEKTITDRAVKVGDTVNIDFVGKKDGVAFDNGSSTGYDLVIGSNSFIEGFEDGLVGAKTGEKRNLNLTFPENYGNEELNGQDVVFEVTVNSIKATVYPELTDALVAEISDKKTVDEYLEYANGQVLVQNQQNAVDKMESDIWSKIVSNAKVSSLPEKEVAKYKQLLLDNYDNTAQQQYGMTYEEFLTAIGESLESVDADIVKEAEQVVTEYMIFIQIARIEGLEVDETEYEEQLVTYAEQNGYSSAKEFEEAIDKSAFRLKLTMDKVMDFVVENAVNTGEAK